ncbi:DHHC palmitoyltransferase [Carpediemonas membranifera]|uniref:Palmitoyltransferase n=1 Tax=Carpediemonas membranifera TaxID=201153 RepID=A0A8J6E3V8_9EUKA|nr:DHHC palmitoyltransferase [Carpediemonas membranifera]|eukprot:KAG9396071.1 DHHC palmitoyltransferase [Carpediemonas membranifera]
MTEAAFGFKDVMFLSLKIAEVMFGVGLHIFQPLVIIFCFGLIAILSAFFGLGVVQPMDYMIFRVPWLVLTMFQAINISFNYVLCIVTGPGNPPFKEAIESGDVKINTDSTVKIKICKKCHRIKPERCHHCSLCKKCVYRMDHHCPWIATCVGHYNYPYFYKFLFHSWLGCGVAFVMAAPRMLGLWGLDRGGPAGVSYLTSLLALCGAIFLAVSFLLLWHTYLLCTNQTTLEFYDNKTDYHGLQANGHFTPNPYHLGWWKKNVEQAFGPGSFVQLLVKLIFPMRIRPAGDGIVWDKRTIMKAVQVKRT